MIFFPEIILKNYLIYGIIKKMKKKGIRSMKNIFCIDKYTVAMCDPKMINSVVKRLWSGFCFMHSEIRMIEGDKNIFRIGTTEIPTLPADKEYALRVDENGVSIIGNSFGGLMRGFMTLILKIEMNNEKLTVKSCDETDNYKIKNRMAHICVYHDDDMYFIKKLVRVLAVCQFTHVVIEFWGMLKYDCLKELSWPEAFSKSEVRQLIKEVRQLGMEPIPMSNQLGHASSARGCYGKHVVLDQNLALQDLFTPDGWAWNIRSKKVFNLLRDMRFELYDLFGDGEYIHIGFDEAYYYSHNEKDRKLLPEYINKITTQVAAEGRSPMLWMDMFLEKGAFEGCYSACPKEDVEKMISALHPLSVAVDWQYWNTNVPITSLDFLNSKGLDVIGAPWLNPNNQKAVIDTIVNGNMFGIMLTTWHTLKNEYTGLLECSKALGASTVPWAEYSPIGMQLATILRKVSFEGNTFEDSGWSKHEIET